MKDRESRYTELVVRVKPRPYRSSYKAKDESSSAPDGELSDTEVRSYDARIYAPPGLVSVETKDAQQSGRPEIGGLPLAGTESVAIHWGLYENYLRAIRPSMPEAQGLLNKLVDFPPPLESILTGKIGSTLQVRVWWNNEAPELEELPWEQIVAQFESRDRPLSFVRGVPPEPPPPLVPISGPVRLALVRDDHNIPNGLDAALNDLPSDIQLVDLPGSPQQALQQALKEGYEMLHIVAYGMVSLAYEGIIDLGFSPGSDYEDRPPDARLADRFTAQELYSLLRGSRVALIGLTPPAEIKIKITKTDRAYMPTTYRAFTHFGRSNVPLPSIVAPTAPLSERQVGAFWSGFYAGLSGSWDVEHAMINGIERSGQPPVALFLRQPNARLFRLYDMTNLERVETSFEVAPPSEAGSEAETQAQPPLAEVIQPTQIASDLQLSQELVKRLSASAGAGESAEIAPASISEFLRQETGHQQQLAEQLEPWQQLKEDE